VTGIRTGAIDLREAAVASALAGAVVVALGYASGLGVPLRNDAVATLEQPATAPGVAAPVTPPTTPPMSMPMAPSYAGAAGGMAGMAGGVTGGMAGMAGMDMGGAVDGPGAAHGEPAPTTGHDPAPQGTAAEATCRDLLSALPTSDLPIVGSLTGTVTGSVEGLVGGLLGSGAGSGSSLAGSLTAPVTDLLTTPLAGGAQSPPPCLPGGHPLAARAATR
jgi:hypothetical protein